MDGQRKEKIGSKEKQEITGQEKKRKARAIETMSKKRKRYGETAKRTERRMSKQT